MAILQEDCVVLTWYLHCIVFLDRGLIAVGIIAIIELYIEGYVSGCVTRMDGHAETKLQLELRVGIVQALEKDAKTY